jgi:hypothetical protein
LTTVNATADAAIIAPDPTATIPAWTDNPDAMPAAVATPAGRPHRPALRTTSAKSGPGAINTTRNARV